MTPKHTTQLINAFFATLLVTALPLLAIAQDPGGGPDAPIDGGISILLVAGAAYGVKKYRDVVKKKDGVEEL